MPGMMDTVLNLGLNDEVVEAIANKTQNPRFAWDSYRRVISMFGNVVKGIQSEEFENILDSIKKKKGAESDTELDTEDLQRVVEHFKKGNTVLLSRHASCQRSP